MSIVPRVTRSFIITSIGLLFLSSVPVSARLQTAKPEEQTVPPDTNISLERTGCYGTCPIYTVSISADGTVLFVGTRFVKKMGTTGSTVSREQIRNLLSEFDKINYFELKDQYVSPDDGCKQWVTDHPSAITSITRGGKSKTIKHYYGCRGLDVLKDLEKLELSIDNAVNSSQWIR